MAQPPENLRFRHLGTPVDQIAVDDILGILKPIWATRPETASRVRGRVESVLDAAKVRGLRSGENPAAWRGNLALLLPARKKSPKRHHPAMPFMDAPAFLEILNGISALSARALELTALTVARTSEVLLARWSEFDLEAATSTIGAERMKAGREHRIPLPTAAITLLKKLKTNDEFVFPGQAEGKPPSNMAMAMCLRRTDWRTTPSTASAHPFAIGLARRPASLTKSPRWLLLIWSEMPWSVLIAAVTHSRSVGIS